MTHRQGSEQSTCWQQGPYPLKALSRVARILKVSAALTVVDCYHWHWFHQERISQRPAEQTVHGLVSRVMMEFAKVVRLVPLQ